MVQTCAQCTWFHPGKGSGTCRAHSYIGEGHVLYASTFDTQISCHKFREGQKRHQVDNFELGSSYYAHSQDHE